MTNGLQPATVDGGGVDLVPPPESMASENPPTEDASAEGLGWRFFEESDISQEDDWRRLSGSTSEAWSALRVDGCHDVEVGNRFSPFLTVLFPHIPVQNTPAAAFLLIF